MEYNMPPVEGINWEKAHHYMPEKDVLLDVIREFVTSRDEQIDRLISMKTAVESDPSEDNYTSYRIQAHAMKASLRSLGADLFDMALSLEEAGRDHVIEVIGEKTVPFTEKYTELAKRLEEVVGPEDEGGGFDELRFFARIDTLEGAMDSFDIKLLQETFKEIKGMPVPDEYRQVVKELEAAVRDLSADDVKACCGQLRTVRSEQ